MFSADLNDPIHVGTARLGKFLCAPGKEDLYSARGCVNENALRSVSSISERMDHSLWDKHRCALRHFNPNAVVEKLGWSVEHKEPFVFVPVEMRRGPTPGG